MRDRKKEKPIYLRSSGHKPLPPYRRTTQFIYIKNIADKIHICGHVCLVLRCKNNENGENRNGSAQKRISYPTTDQVQVNWNIYLWKDASQSKMLINAAFNLLIHLMIEYRSDDGAKRKKNIHTQHWQWWCSQDDDWKVFVQLFYDDIFHSTSFQRTISFQVVLLLTGKWCRCKFIRLHISL